MTERYSQWWWFDGSLVLFLHLTSLRSIEAGKGWSSEYITYTGQRQPGYQLPEPLNYPPVHPVHPPVHPSYYPHPPATQLVPPDHFILHPVDPSFLVGPPRPPPPPTRYYYRRRKHGKGDGKFLKDLVLKSLETLPFMLIGSSFLITALSNGVHQVLGGGNALEVQGLVDLDLRQRIIDAEILASIQNQRETTFVQDSELTDDEEEEY